MGVKGHEGFWYAFAFVSLASLTALGLKIGEDFIVPAILVLGIGGAVVLRGAIGKALAERIRAGAATAPSPEVIAELDELRGRVLELEERLDFAERMLAAGRADQPTGALARGPHAEG